MADPTPQADAGPGPMRLALVCESLESRDPVGRQALALSALFASRGHTVTLICGVDAGEQGGPGLEVQGMGAYRLRSPRRLAGFRRWAAAQLDAQPFDARLTFTTLVPADVLAPVQGMAGAYRTFLKGLPAPLPVRARLYTQACRPALWLRDALERRTLSDARVKLIVSDNDLIAAQLDASAGVSAGRCRHVDPALTAEPTDWKRAAELRDRFARALGLPDHAAVLAAPFSAPLPGGFTPLMLGFKALIDRGHDAVLLLAGPLRYTHLAWVAQLGVRPRVRVLGACDDPAPLIAAADAVVMPALHDPAGRAGLSAMAQGKPLITTRACGAAQWLGGLPDSDAGRVLDCPTPPDQLADAMAACCDPENRPGKPPAGLADRLVLTRRADALLALLAEAAGRPVDLA